MSDPKWLAIARGEVGVKESAGILKNHPRIIQYHAATKLKARTDEIPWCASFVTWCLEQSGTRSLRSARAADYATYGRETYLEPGAIVVFGKADPDAGGSGHVAFLVGVDGDQLLVLGGNQSNAVTIARRPVSRMVACRWPDERS